MLSGVALRQRVIPTILFLYACAVSQAVAQSEGVGEEAASTSIAGSEKDSVSCDLILPAGERLVLSLEQDLDTSKTRVGEPSQLVMVHEIFLGLGPRLSIPAGAPVDATITKVQRRKRPFGKPLIEFRIDSLKLPGGEILPLQATVLRELGKVTRKGPDLLMPKGVLIEVMLQSNLVIPVAGGTLSPWKPSPAATPQKTLETISSVASSDLTTEMAKLFSENTEALAAASDKGSFTMKLHVDRVLVQAVVRDHKGRVIEGLKKDDFIIREDGKKQVIREFSPDLRPLALALVVDGSGSIEPYKIELQDAARETLAQLSFDDQVCLFVFSGGVRRINDLTDNINQTSTLISRIDPDGRTNIYDAVLDASYYLERSAPNLRHAIIMISDNWATEIGRAGEGSAIRMALQTETVVYSLKLPASLEPPSLTALSESVWMGDQGLVERITDATGGEIIELEKTGTLSKALSSILSTLKQRYSLSYSSRNHKGGEFHTIEVSLTPRFGRPTKHYTVHTRRGYYAPLTP